MSAHLGELGERCATWFGARVPYDELELAFERVGDATFAALVDAWQVTVIDPRWGRDDLLWPTLEQIAETPPSPDTEARPSTLKVPSA